MTAADDARARFEAQAAAPGHATENVRLAARGLEEALASGALRRTPALDAMLADLATALDAGEGRPGAKSAEAARLIARAISRELARQA